MPAPRLAIQWEYSADCKTLFAADATEYVAPNYPDYITCRNLALFDPCGLRMDTGATAQEDCATILNKPTAGETYTLTENGVVIAYVVTADDIVEADVQITEEEATELTITNVYDKLLALYAESFSCNDWFALTKACEEGCGLKVTALVAGVPLFGSFTVTVVAGSDADVSYATLVENVCNLPSPPASDVTNTIEVASKGDGLYCAQLAVVETIPNYYLGCVTFVEGAIEGTQFYITLAGLGVGPVYGLVAGSASQTAAYFAQQFNAYVWGILGYTPAQLYASASGARLCFYVSAPFLASLSLFPDDVSLSFCTLFDIESDNSFPDGNWGTMEDGISGIEYAPGATNFVESQSNEQAHSGTFSYKLNIVPDGEQCGSVRHLQELMLTAGRTYTIEAWVYVTDNIFEDPSSEIAIEIESGFADAVVGAQTKWLNDTSAYNTWVRVATAFTVGADIEGYFRINIGSQGGFYVPASEGVEGDFYIDDVRIFSACQEWDCEDDSLYSSLSPYLDGAQEGQTTLYRQSLCTPILCALECKYAELMKSATASCEPDRKCVTLANEVRILIESIQSLACTGDYEGANGLIAYAHKLFLGSPCYGCS